MDHIDTEELGYISTGDETRYFTDELGWMDERAVKALNEARARCAEQETRIGKLNRRVEMLLDLLEEERQPPIQITSVEPPPATGEAR